MQARAHVLIALVWPLLVLWQPGCSRPASPNVVLITLDTLRRDRLASYGYPRHTSPNLDALAKRGVRFDDAIAQSTTTPPSHASILTGLNPATHGLRKLYGQGLPHSNETLAEILSAEGYSTAAFISAVPLRRYVGLDQGFDHYDDSWDDSSKGAAAKGEEEVHDRPARATNEKVFEWLRTAPDRPVFLWIHYFDPHYPYFPPEEWRRKFGVDKAIREFLPMPVNMNPETKRDTRLRQPQPRVVKKMQDLYDAEIAYMDRAIGDLLGALETAGILPNAIVAFVADHGEQLGEYGYYFGHWGVLEETARIPMVLVHPDERFAGKVVEAPTGAIDLVPTILAWLGVEPDLEFDGLDLTAHLEGEPLPSRVIYTDQFEYFQVRSVRDDEWLLEQRAGRRKPLDGGALYLYRRLDDANALEPVDGFPAVRSRLENAMQAAAKPAKRHARRKLTVPDDVREQLRALGYTNEAEAPE